mgnify:CR=1 FL=1
MKKFLILLIVLFTTISCSTPFTEKDEIIVVRKTLLRNHTYTYEYVLYLEREGYGYNYDLYSNENYELGDTLKFVKINNTKIIK